jgi:UDP-3-O-[3-hydroxymyristoyl] N-acetylglucosamine deacetylase
MASIVFKQALFRGVGLHSGRNASATVKLATAGSGITFELLDHGRAQIPALWTSVSSTNHCTTLADDVHRPVATVSTVEHLLAALHMCHIHDAVVEVEGPEIPILDGSSLPFVQGLRENGLSKERTHEKGDLLDPPPYSFIRVLQPVQASLGRQGTVGWLLPPPTNTGTVQRRPQLSLSVDVDFSHKSLPRRVVSGALHDSTFIEQVAAARTFTFEEEYDVLVKAGLVGGGSMENAILYDAQGVPMNEHGLRMKDEHAWHKMLDCVGDLTLAGLPIDGHYHAIKPGHGLNVRLVQHLMEDVNNHAIVRNGA